MSNSFQIAVSIGRSAWAVLCFAASITAAAAAEFPSKPIRIVLGFPPGSAADAVTRVVSDRIAEILAQRVVVDNRPGAGGTIATDAVVRAPADGYTLLVSGCSADGIVYGYVMTGRPPLDPLQDFTPVGQVMRDQWIVAVPRQSEIRDLAHLVESAKSSEAPLAYPSTGIGSSQHLQSARVAKRLGIQAQHVPYKDSQTPDLLAGRVAFVVSSAAGIAPLVASGALKGLAVLSTERLASVPTVPTMVEAGYPDLLYTAGVCLYAPGGTPADVVGRLNAALNAAEASDKVRDAFATLGVEPIQRSPAETARFITELMALVDSLRVDVFGKAR